MSHFRCYTPDLYLQLPFCVRDIASYILSFISTPLSIVAGSYVKNLEDLRITQTLTEQYIEKVFFSLVF